eukprot:scaffold199460_cov27-Tisochrysis_lutea.AAC.3
MIDQCDAESPQQTRAPLDVVFKKQLGEQHNGMMSHERAVCAFTKSKRTISALLRTAGCVLELSSRMNMGSNRSARAGEPRQNLPSATKALAETAGSHCPFAKCVAAATTAEVGAENLAPGEARERASVSSPYTTSAR